MAEQIQTQPAKWVKANLYKAMTGHTLDTLKKLRAKTIEGKHWKKSKLDNAIYYDWQEIDKRIERS
jgi:hypothetical protein